MHSEHGETKTQSDIDRSSIYIQNFNSNITLEKLENHFSEELKKTGGSIIRLTVVERKKKSLSSFAYVEFDSEITRDYILQLNHTQIDDQLFSIFKKRTNIPKHIRKASETQHNKENKAGKRGHPESQFLFHISASTKKQK